MRQANFAYSAPANDAAGLPVALSIFADRAHVCGTLRDDAEAAGFRVVEASGLDALSDDDARALGDVILVDCPAVDAATMAALTRLDMRAAHTGAHLIVSTSVAALDDVFACLDQSAPQILVDPGRADQVVALGRVLARLPDVRVRELSEDDRMALLRLTEQVTQLAQRIDRLSGGGDAARSEPQGSVADGGVFRFESPRPAFSGASDDDPGERLIRAARPPLPDPRLVRRIIRQRQLRARFFESDLFGDPAWDMLLDLTAARAEHSRVSVTSLCIASGVPPTTALRWIGQMSEAGLFQRVEDPGDRRRAFIALSDTAADAMARYFAAQDADALRLI